MKHSIEHYEYSPLKKYNPSNTLFCYLRVSSKKQVDDGNSIDNQFHTGLKISESMGMTLCVLNEGGTSSSDRKSDSKDKFFLVQRLISDKVMKHLWYFSRSRWTRTTLEDLTCKNNYFKPHKVTVYEGESGSQRNFTDPNEEFVDNILTGVQQLDRENRRLVSVSGKRHLSKHYGHTGVFLGGTPRIGYQTVEKKWELGKDESEWVKKIFGWYSQGKSIKWIKSELDSRGVTPRRSNSWVIGTLSGMLNNEGYTGYYKWVDDETKDEFTIIIPQIISHSLFNKTKRMMKRNQKNKGNNSRRYESLLSDFMVCSCGQNICGNVNKGTRKSGEQINSQVYICSSRSNHWKGKTVNPCENRRTLNMNDTDNFVVTSIKKVVNDSHTLKDRFKKDILKDKNKQDKEITKEKKSLEVRIRNYDSQIDITTDSISKVEINNMLKKIDTKIYPKLIKGLKEELVHLEEERNKTIQQIDDLDNRKEWVDWVGKFGEEIEKNLDEKRHETIHGLIKELVVYPVMGSNRDGVTKQVGHKIKIHFQLPIVKDSFSWNDDNDKKKGSTTKEGQKVFQTELLPVNVGGRPKKKVT